MRNFKLRIHRRNNNNAFYLKKDLMNFIKNLMLISEKNKK